MFRLARRLVSLVLVVLVVYLGVSFVHVYQASRRDEAAPADAIVVFGAAHYNGRPSPVLRARLDHAADLYKRQLAPTIVVTGGRASGDETSEATASADYLSQRKGIRQSAILREKDGRNSWQSLASAANELRKRGKTKVVLVSDPFHAARIGAMADELGLDAAVSPTRTSPISGQRELRHLGRETVAVAAGRFVGFRRLMRIDTVVVKAREADRSG
ncbi:MAG: YdcF family protein [Actinobacteria bacterium]|nr:YdcF family protein [Actinomycetota bacterium]MBW3650349.1 YdcF family protein [Actinomycetota bacterium]